MGLSVSKGLKYRSEVLLEEFPENFGMNFQKNKEELNKLPLGLSKTSRNVVAGYITRLANKKEQEALKK
ncbi:MAG: 30S ribosomal protein S17e [archaeon]